MATTPKQKYFYVTGCDTGFGNMLVKKLDTLGYGVFAGVFLSETTSVLKNECSDRVVPVQVDVSDETSVEHAAAFIRKHIKKNPDIELAGLVNNAGVLITPGPTEWTPISSYRRMVDVNVYGTVMVTKSVLPLIRKSQGRIVNVASLAGRVALPSQPAYCVSKFAVEGYSDVLRKDMYQWNVTVSIIEPGVFSKTGLYGDYQTGLDRLWTNLPDHLKKDYGEEYYRSFRFALGHALDKYGNTNTELVPDAMVHALTSPHPKYRYRVGNDSKFLATVLSWLHESIQDTVLTANTSKHKRPNPVTAPKNGKELCTARYAPSPYRYWLLVLCIIWIYRRFLKK